MNAHICELPSTRTFFFKRSIKKCNATQSRQCSSTSHIVQALIDEAKQWLEDISVKLNDAANAARSNYQIIRWENTRLTDSLVEGEHGLAVAQNISEKVVSFVHLKDNKPETLKEFYEDSVLINPSVEQMKSRMCSAALTELIEIALEN